MKKELEVGLCDACGSTPSKLCVHHKDGDHKNNKKTNLVILCWFCHIRVHKGIRYRDRKLDLHVKDKLQGYRRILLNNKKFYTEEEIENLLKFEAFEATTHSPRRTDICWVCSRKKNLIWWIHPNFRGFVPESKVHRHGLRICKKCLKELQSNIQ